MCGHARQDARCCMYAPGRARPHALLALQFCFLCVCTFSCPHALVVCARSLLTLLLVCKSGVVEGLAAAAASTSTSGAARRPPLPSLCAPRQDVWRSAPASSAMKHTRSRSSARQGPSSCASQHAASRERSLRKSSLASRRPRRSRCRLARHRSQEEGSECSSRRPALALLQRAALGPLERRRCAGAAARKGCAVAAQQRRCADELLPVTTTRRIGFDLGRCGRAVVVRAAAAVEGQAHKKRESSTGESIAHLQHVWPPCSLHAASLWGVSAGVWRGVHTRLWRGFGAGLWSSGASVRRSHGQHSVRGEVLAPPCISSTTRRRSGA